MNSDPQNEKPDSTETPGAAPVEAASPKPIEPAPAAEATRRPGPTLVPTPPPDEPSQDRRDFFGEALREVLTPLSSLLEWRIAPVLEAIEQMPAQMERAAGFSSGPLDQPQLTSGRTAKVQLEQPDHYLRPPGALPPGEYESVCSRCGKCVEFCPANAIKLDKTGIIADGAPYIVPTEQPCVVCEPLACMHACPSGALKLLDKLQIRMGLARVNFETCLRTRGDDCRVCVDACPIGSTALTISPTSGRVIVKKNGCVGCGVCEQMCQTWPRSITVHQVEVRKDPLIA